MSCHVPLAVCPRGDQTRSCTQGDDLQIESEGSEDDDTDYEDDSDDGMLEELDGKHAVDGVTV
jgi:hypothetical protein